MTSLANQTVLVIGGTSGIGYGVAERSLLEHASYVIIASSTKTKVDAAVAKLAKLDAKAKVTGDVVDAKSSTSIKELLGRVGEIDHLVWTSGDPLKVGNKDADLTGLKDIFDVRFWGPATAAQAAKIKPGGSITFTIGSVVKKPIPGWAAVSGTAGATEALTRGLALDYAPIRVNVISPGLVKTELWDPMMNPEQQEGFFAESGKKLPVGFVAGPEDIAEAYLFVMKCKYITGQRIDVDGGVSLV